MEITKKIVLFISLTSIVLLTISPQTQSLDSIAPLKALIEASQEEFNEAIQQVKEYPKEKYGSEFTGQCLDVCRENFEAALSSIKDAAEAMDRNDGNRLQTMLTAIATSVTTCDDAFKERPQAGTPLEQITIKLRDTIDKTLALSASFYNLIDGPHA